MGQNGSYWGESKTAKELGKQTRQKDRFVWCKCPVCGTGKWTSASTPLLEDGVTSTTKCRPCFVESTKGTRTTPGARRKDTLGYIRVYLDPSDPYFDMAVGHQVTEHRYVMAMHLKRSLKKWENVHHKNGIRDDNRIENLELWAKPQPAGQRVEDVVIDYLNSLTTEQVVEIIARTPHAKLLACQASCNIAF